MAERKGGAVAKLNSCVEADYHRVINAVKSLHLKRGEVFYERDLRQNHTEGLLGMHSFVTSNFSWFLLCSMCLDYQVLYAFGNCPYEAEIKAVLRTYPLDRQAFEKAQPDFATYYQTVLNVQEPQFLFTL